MRCVENLVGFEMSKSKPCSKCPFRIGSSIGYDLDAMEALEDGWEPSCHKLVGKNSIFKERSPVANRCRGYDAMQQGEKGFGPPKLART